MAVTVVFSILRKPQHSVERKVCSRLLPLKRLPSDSESSSLVRRKRKNQFFVIISKYDPHGGTEFIPLYMAKFLAYISIMKTANMGQLKMRGPSKNM
jgi:hypothetical protein